MIVGFRRVVAESFWIDLMLRLGINSHKDGMEAYSSKLSLKEIKLTYSYCFDFCCSMLQDSI